MKSLFAATALAMFLTSSAQGAEVKVGQSAPPFTVKTLTGKTFRLKDARGKVVLLDFWGVACPPCKIQMPLLQRWHKHYAERGMIIVGIEAMGTETKAIRKALKERGVTYPVA
jgi:thiol-disulfide isomerase/thioredoxin